VAVARLEPDSEAGRRFVVGWLIGMNGSTRGESFPVRTGRNVLGRSRSSDIWVHDEQASAHHADLVYRPEEKRYILMDHNSTNGTYVNGVEIEPRRDLVSRDIVTIGSHKLLFVALSDFGLDWDDHGDLR
jgi:pSer/pThr/pTyr-binding forkhead associated (FHA) protein